MDPLLAARHVAGDLARTMLAGTLPGVVLGAFLRVEYLSGSRAFLIVVAAVLLSLGAWLLAGDRRRRREQQARAPGAWLRRARRRSGRTGRSASRQASAVSSGATSARGCSRR